jgi:phosphomevalonate kinase
LRLTLPGNLLITGEFAILEEGGQGVTLAVEQRFTLEARSSDQWAITSHFPEETRAWVKGSDPFLDRLMAYLQQACPWAKPQSVTLDSRNLFGQDRQGGTRKLGLGSSACTAGALTALFHRLNMATTDAKPPEGTDPELSQKAVLAHRAAQGKEGSGYDVLCSLGGGLGLFTGGKQPRWSPLPLPEGHFALYPGASSVGTLRAIDTWKEWKKNHDDLWQSYRRENHQIVQGFKDGRWSQAFEEAKSWGLRLGKKLGISAEIQNPEDLSSGAQTLLAQSLYKALGAGNEIALIHSPSPPNPPYLAELGAWPIGVAQEGLLWQ